MMILFVQGWDVQHGCQSLEDGLVVLHLDRDHLGVGGVGVAEVVQGGLEAVEGLAGAQALLDL